MVERFQPLDQELNEDLLLEQQWSSVNSICNSYHCVFDSFAESVQNAMDALERRWGDSEVFDNEAVDGRPELKVSLDFRNNYVEVLDNGSGMTKAQMQRSLKPFISDKRNQSGARGHKGVGTTYLIYDHNEIEIHSKSLSEIHGYRLDGGRDWRVSDEPSSILPEFVELEDSTTELDNFDSGTLVRYMLGPDSSYGMHLSSTRYHSFGLWEMVLRTYTAIGHITLPTSETSPKWIESLNVELNLINVTGKGEQGPKNIKPQFYYPHMWFKDHEKVNLGHVLATTSKRRRKFLLAHLSWSTTDIKTSLGPVIDDLRTSGDEEKARLHKEIVEQLDEYEISVYASLTHENTAYHDRWKKAIGRPTAQQWTNRQVRGGTLVASVGMPIGETLDHREEGHTFLPEYRKRFFLIVKFNNKYRPDIGRKTVPTRHVAVINWLEKEILKAIRVKSKDLLKLTPGGAPRGAVGYTDAKHQLDELIVEIGVQNSSLSPIELGGVSPSRPPTRESEVGIQFSSLITSEYLVGYKNFNWLDHMTLYDGLFDVYLTEPTLEKPPHNSKFGIAEERFVGKTGRRQTFERRSQWAEFKLELRTLVSNFELEDGEQSKKYFELVQLAICDNTSGDLSDYVLTRFDDTNQEDRKFPGSTHYLEHPGSEHVLEVIELNVLIAGLETERSI